MELYAEVTDLRGGFSPLALGLSKWVTGSDQVFLLVLVNNSLPFVYSLSFLSTISPTVPVTPKSPLH